MVEHPLMKMVHDPLNDAKSGLYKLLINDFIHEPCALRVVIVLKYYVVAINRII